MEETKYFNMQFFKDMTYMLGALYCLSGIGFGYNPVRVERTQYNLNKPAIEQKLHSEWYGDNLTGKVMATFFKPFREMGYLIHDK